MNRGEGRCKALAYTNYILLCTLSIASGVLFFTALYYSLNTPFALIDDYGDWLVAKYWAQDGEFLKWFDHVFLSDSLVRYRPFFELYTYAAWTLLGPSAPLHHLARWGLKMACLLFSILTLARFLHLGKNQADVAPNQNRYALFWPSILLATIFLFFPNQPDARLAPQELNFVFFLTILNYSICMLLPKQDEIVRLSFWTYILFVLGYIGLSLSKEISIAVLAWVILFLMVTARKDNFLSRIILLIPTTCIFLFTLWRVKLASTNATYGTKTITTDLFFNNFKWLYKDVFQFSTSLVLGIVLLVLFFYPLLKSILKRIHAANTSSRSWFILFLSGEFIFIFGILSVSWMQVLRYWYPLIALLAILSAITINMWMQEYGKKSIQLVIRTNVLAICIFFIFANGYNFMLQYMSQYANRNVDEKVISYAISSIKKGNSVYILLNDSDPDMELNDKFQLLFRHYLPYYDKLSLDLNVKKDSSEVSNEGILLSTKNSIKDFYADKIFVAEYDSYLLEIMFHVSALTQLRNTPRVRLDAGVHSQNYTWYGYRKNDDKL